MSPSVMIVDDDPDILEVITMVLEGSGFRVLSARGGAQALDLLEKAHDFPGVIVLDLMMPGMSGAELLDRMRRAGRSTDRVIVLSGAGDAAVQAAHLGAVEYLPKPVELGRLLAAIRRVQPQPQP